MKRSSSLRFLYWGALFQQKAVSHVKNPALLSAVCLPNTCHSTPCQPWWLLRKYFLLKPPIVQISPFQVRISSIVKAVQSKHCHRVSHLGHIWCPSHNAHQPLCLLLNFKEQLPTYAHKKKNLQQANSKLCPTNHICIQALWYMKISSTRPISLQSDFKIFSNNNR